MIVGWAKRCVQIDHLVAIYLKEWKENEQLNPESLKIPRADLTVKLCCFRPDLKYETAALITFDTSFVAYALHIFRWAVAVSPVKDFLLTYQKRSFMWLIHLRDCILFARRQSFNLQSRIHNKL